MNPGNPMAFSATCPACGVTVAYPLSGRVWMSCAACGWSGYQWANGGASLVNPTSPGVAPQPSLPSQSAGQPMPVAQPSWMAQVARGTLPPLTLLGDPDDIASGSNMVPLTPPMPPPLTLPEALAGDARLFGEEIALALLDCGGVSVGVSVERDCSLSLPQVWDRYQEAQDALFETLGGRHMGDYDPDLEQLSQAFVRIGAWAMVALQVVGRMGDDGDSEA